MESKDHLNPAARAMLGASAEDRINFVKRKSWFGYPHAAQALELLEAAYTQPPSSRTWHVQLIGDTNNGKTSVLEEFARRKGAPFPEQGDLAVLKVIAATSAEEKRLWVVLLIGLGGAFRYSDSAELLYQRTVTLLRNRHVGMVVLDEFHESFSGSPAQRRQLLSSVKRLGNDVKIPIVVAGMPILRGFINADPQIANRFRRVALPTWQLDGEFQDLLENIETGLPLPTASQLWEPETAKLIFAKTEGLVGEVFEFLRLAAVTAISRDVSNITPELLNEIPWIPPSQRQGLD